MAALFPVFTLDLAETHEVFPKLVSAHLAKCNSQEKPHSLALVYAECCVTNPKDCHSKLNFRITPPGSLPWLLTRMRRLSSGVHSSHFITFSLPLDVFNDLLFVYFPTRNSLRTESMSPTCVSRAQHREKWGKREKIKPSSDSNLLPW